jgi:hypothetical protein
MEVILNQNEMEVLERVLKLYLPELKSEVYHTESHDWRESLKADEEVLRSLLSRLDAATAAGSSRPA